MTHCCFLTDYSSVDDISVINYFIQRKVYCYRNFNGPFKSVAKISMVTKARSSFMLFQNSVTNGCKINAATFK